MRDYCCIFLQVFGCGALITLVEIFISMFFVLKSRKIQKSRKFATKLSKQDRFTTCFKTCETGSLFRRVEWGFKVSLMTLWSLFQSSYTLYHKFPAGPLRAAFHVLFNLLSLWLVGTPQASVSMLCWIFVFIVSYRIAKCIKGNNKGEV